MKKTTLNLAMLFASTLACTSSHAQDDLISIWDNYNAPQYDPQNPRWWDVQSSPCTPQASPWVLGGNIMASNINPFSNIGTCNNWPFILKANNFESVFIQPSGFIGINNPAPAAALDVKSPVPGSATSTRIYGDGMIESTAGMNLKFAAGNVLNVLEGTTSRINVSNGYVGINKPFPGTHLHVGGDARIDGNLGVNCFASGASKMDVYDANSSLFRVMTGSSNAARVEVVNNLLSYGMQVDNAAIGHIYSGINLINFKPTGNPGSQYPQVWIGKRPTAAPYSDFQLAVDGKLVAKSVYVTLNGVWADYVFEKDYKLASLKDVESYYRKNKHLPEVPSAKEVEENGINVADMNVVLLKKIEELTLYVVDQQKEIEALKSKIK